MMRKTGTQGAICPSRRMARRFALLLMLLFGLLLGPPAVAQEAPAISGGGGLVVSGIDVDTQGKTDIEARLNGWREAQRLAWPALWARMSGQPAADAPKLADNALNAMVSAIEIEREQVGGNRYVARLAVVFDRARAASSLGRYAALATSPPFLVMPVLQDGGARFGHEADSPWLAAWARLRAGESPIDYIRIQPTPGDTILLSAWATERRNVGFWRMLVDRYAVADVLQPEMILERTHAGGPVSGLLIVRFGPTGREIGRVRLNSASGDINGMFDLAVREADRIHVAAMRAGNLLPDPKLVDDAPVEIAEGPALRDPVLPGPALTFRIRTDSPDDAALMRMERALRQVPGVASVRTSSYVLGGQSLLELSTPLSLEELRFALDGAGLRLEGVGDGLLVRPRRPDEVPLAPPPVVPPAAAPTSILPAG